jgi:pimeloyl-ACP methyl ester carboxylesterase
VGTRTPRRTFLRTFDEYIWSFNVMRLISQAHFGGGQFSEIHQTVGRIREGDPNSWYLEWKTAAEKVEGLAREAEASGHRVSARGLFQRACEYWRMANFFLPPDDPRALPAYERSVNCFAGAGKYFEPPLESVLVPYENTTLPGYFIPGRGQAPDTGWPTVIFFGGADSTAEELYFTAPGIEERGLARIIVDGPGQGAALRLQALPTRHDYEVPVSAAVDYALTRPDVDPERLVLLSMSLGGYYAARAAAFEHRLKAVVIWGACYDYSEVWAARPDDHPLASHIVRLFGASDIRDARHIMERYTLAGILDGIRCPALVVHGEDDASVPVDHAHRTYNELDCEKELVIFRAGESGSAHCQQDNLTRANEVIFDWVLDTLERLR